MSINTINNPTNNITAGCRVLHPVLEHVADECKMMLNLAAGANLLLVCGPTGVGKTTLGNYLVEIETKRHEKQMHENVGLIPAIKVEAISSGEREFAWRDLFTRILRNLEGDLQLPRSASGLLPSSDNAARPLVPRSNRLADLRAAVEPSLHARGTRVVIIDEAAHIIKQTSSKYLENQINTLKSLSNECNVQWVLLGSYDLYDLVSLSGQLARRTHVTHFRRYRVSENDDIRAFLGCIRGLIADIPGLEDLNLKRWGRILMENSLGCVGTLRSILLRVRSFSNSLQMPCDSVVEHALLTHAQLERIMQEIIEGEALIRPGVERSFDFESVSSAKKNRAKKVA